MGVQGEERRRPGPSPLAITVIRAVDARPVAVGVGALLVVCALSLRLAGAPDAAVVSLVAPAVILVAVTEWLLARKHLRRDVLVARVTALATGGEPLQRILDGVLDELAGEGFGAGSIGLPGADGVELVATSAGADPRERERRLALCRAAIGRLAERSPLVVNDVARDRGPELWSGTARGRVLSVAAVPVPVGQDAVGVLAVHSTVPRRFPQDDVHLFEAIGAVVGGAVMRAAPLRLANEQLRRRVHELTGLQESARALAASLDIDTVVGEVLAAATDGLEAPFAAIVRREDSILRLAAVRADGVDGVAGGARVAASSAGTLVAAMDAQEPVTLPARALTVLPELVPIVAELAVVSALCAPLRWAGRSRDALLVAGSARARPFDDADRDHLAGIAHLAELAIGNAERYRSLLQLASTDSLTGVATAPAFERALAEPHPDGLSIVVVDVDRLKEVNDVTGYPAGDETLRRIATALTSIAGDAGLIGRIGGDEFAVLVDGADEEAAADLGDRIRSAMHGVPVPHGLARVSIGVAVGSGTIDRRRVYWSALAAAETATAQGGDAVVRASGLIQPTGRRGPWDHALAALFNGTARVVPVYQPVVRLRDGNVVGHEALARLADAPERGVEGLFAAAQRVGRARDLDWLCRRVALEGARGMASGTMLFVNVGVWALLDRLHDVDQMQLLLRWAGLSAGDVVLELSERELVSDLPRLLEVITSYRAEGFRFAVDDLGEGHSTLEVLSRATPEFIKLASSLTLARSTPGVQSAVAAMVTFAERSGASVIAEGIETAESVQFMLDMGVELGQGRFLGPPGQLPAASAEHAETLEPAT